MDVIKPTPKRLSAQQFEMLRMKQMQLVAKKKVNKLSKLKKGTKAFNIAVVLFFMVVATVPSYYFYHQSQVAKARLNDPNTASRQVIDEVVKKASKHILLPSGEQPTLATVSDISKVKGQPFFQNAQNGDKVLVFTQARKAYLYRPSSDLIIEVAPLNVDSTPQSTSK